MTKLIAITAMVSISTGAHAKPLAVQPVQVGAETVRYQQGVPTVDLKQSAGAVQIRPLPLDHGSLAFAVAVFNGGSQPALIDTTNFDVQTEGQDVAVFTADDLIRKAQNRAMWSQIGLAALGATASVAAASQRNTYRSTLHTPYGSYRSYYSAPSAAGQIQALAITAGTGYGLAAIQNNLDRTREALGNEVVQTSTVDPGQTYAGKIVLQKIKKRKLPQRVTITVHWNGERYPFAFQLAKHGTPAPVFVPVATPAPATMAPIPASAPAHVAASRQMPVPAVPYGVDMVGIVKRTAEVMPRPFTLDDGTKITDFEASGTELVLAVDASASRDVTALQHAAHSAICAARPFDAIIKQGGTVRAELVGKRAQDLGEVQVSQGTCAAA